MSSLDLAALDDTTLSKLTVYASRSLLLERVLRSGDVGVTGHKLVRRNGVEYDDVELDCLTPGRIVKVERNRDGSPGALWVSYEQGSTGLLYFSQGNAPYEINDQSTGPEPAGVTLDGLKYAKAGCGEYPTNYDLSNQTPRAVEWGRCVSDHSLLIDRQDLESVQRNVHKLPGNAPTGD